MPLALRFLSWDPDTEEARVRLVPAGPESAGYVALLAVRDEAHAREIVRRCNACPEINTLEPT